MFMSIAATPTRRVCSPSSPDELFLDRHPMMSEDFLCDGAENPLVKLVGIIGVRAHFLWGEGLCQICPNDMTS